MTKVAIVFYSGYGHTIVLLSTYKNHFSRIKVSRG